MSNTMQRMGIHTGGGDCPGLNAVIRAAVKTAINEYRWEVLGIEDGFEGLIKPNATRQALEIAAAKHERSNCLDCQRGLVYFFSSAPPGVAMASDASAWR
jgi:6-phosphofructokinase